MAFKEERLFSALQHLKKKTAFPCLKPSEFFLPAVNLKKLDILPRVTFFKRMV